MDITLTRQNKCLQYTQRVKETMNQELKETREMMFSQIENINKDTEFIKRTK